MKKELLFLLMLISFPFQRIIAQPSNQVSGKRTYALGILEMNNNERMSFNNQFEKHFNMHQGMNTRGPFISALFAANRSALLTKTVTTTEKVLDVAINHLSNDVKDPRGRWENAVKKECYFSQKVWMKDDIKDFYSDISTNGPLDPSNIVFKGFSCREVFKSQDGKSQDVFYVFCRLDTSASKIKRMISHSKFEICVDSVWFDPNICDLPNDSLQDISKRIRFNFENREDLHLKIHADITSSWINSFTTISNNQKLGEFDIDIRIDPQVVKNNNGVYIYKLGKCPAQDNDIHVTGESFVVPRSYSGNDPDGKGVWGTGQYKVEMLITETCNIKKDYYTNKSNSISAQPGNFNGPKVKEEWNDNWKREWNLIKSRSAKRTFWNEAWSVIKTQWTGSEWLTEVTSPSTSYLLQEGSTFLNGGVILTKYSQGGMMDTGSNTQGGPQQRKL